MDRASLRAYFEQNPREWAKVAPIHPQTIQSIEKIADNRAYSDAHDLDFKSRKDAREQVCEADCMKDVLRLFRSDAEHERIQQSIRCNRAELQARGYGFGDANGAELSRGPDKAPVDE